MIGPHRLYRKRRGRRPSVVEILEIRRVMDAGSGATVDLDSQLCLAEDAELQNEIQTVGSDANSAEGEIGGFGRFESADQLRDFLLQASVKRWEHLFGRPGDYYWHGEWGGDVVIPFSASAAELRVSATSDAGVNDIALLSNHSETNVQVAGVDEADYVKTDGQYLYVLADDELVIVDAVPADDLSVVSRVELEGTPLAHFLDGDRLTVLSRDWRDGKNLTGVTILDISDRASPELLRHTELEGSYVDSRRIGDVVHVIVSNELFAPAPQLVDIVGPMMPSSGSYQARPATAEPFLLTLDYWPYPPLWWNPTSRYETVEEYVARIKDDILESSVPRQTTFGSGGEMISSGPLNEVTEIFRPVTSTATSMLSIVGFDMSGSDDGPIAAVSVPSNDTTSVYVSTESIYLLQAVTEEEQDATPWSWWTPATNATAIVKFDLDPDSATVEPAAVGQVPGRVLNRFSVDEQDGYLRIATTEGSWWGDDAANHLFVLQQQESELKVVGSIEDLAPGEQIYSARLMGDRGFLVTFRNVDPLFTLDLSDPTNPSLMGELKVPGYSDYLQMIDENHLIGIGRDADEATGRFQELQVSLFDVTDMANPTLVDKYSFDGGRDTWSDANWNPHAVGFFPESGTLAIPVIDDTPWQVTTVGGGSDWERDSSMFVFEIDVLTGFELIGQVEHDGHVNRSIRIENLLYTVSTETIKVNNLSDPSVSRGMIDYATEGVVVAESMWRNPEDPFDVNDDGLVSASDVLLVINDMNTRARDRLSVTRIRLSRDGGDRVVVERSSLAAAEDAERDGAQFMDVNGDGRRDPRDVLAIINRMNQSSNFTGEAEASGRPMADG